MKNATINERDDARPMDDDLPRIAPDDDPFGILEDEDGDDDAREEYLDHMRENYAPDEDHDDDEDWGR